MPPTPKPGPFDEMAYCHVVMESGREHFLPAAHGDRLAAAVDARVMGAYECTTVFDQPVRIRISRIESLAMVTPTSRAHERAFLAVVYPDEWERVEDNDGGDDRPEWERKERGR